MISASEAKKVVTEFIESKRNKQLIEIEEKVIKEAAVGNTCFYFRKSISSDLKDYLVGLGYEIEDYSSQREGVNYKISWN